MKTTVEHKYSIGEIVYATSLGDTGIQITKHRITGVRLISHCSRGYRYDGWTFDPADFEVSYTAVQLGVDSDDDTIFPEDSLDTSPETALNKCLASLRKNAEKQKSYTEYYKNNK